MTGAQQGQQLVGDVLIRDRLPVFVAGLQQQRKHVAALFDAQVGPRIGDKRVDEGVEPAPFAPDMRAPRTQRTQDTPRYLRRHYKQGAKRDHRRHRVTKLVQHGTLGAEHGAQDRAEVIRSIGSNVSNSRPSGQVAISRITSSSMMRS